MKKILVIEDEDNIRDNIEEMLFLEGFDVITAPNGKEGFFKAIKEIPDLILCDVLMPELNGFETIKLIRETKETSLIPFVFLTARTDRTDFRHGMSLGADDYLSKPFTTKELLDSINSRLSRSEKFVAEINIKVKELYSHLGSYNSHEINTPLNGILGFSDLIINYIDSFSKEQIFEFVKSINTSGKRLKQTLDNQRLYYCLSNDILDEVNVIKLVDGFTTNLKSVVEEKSNFIAVNYSRLNDLVIDIGNYRVKMPENGIEFVFYEIIDNAFKFSKAGSIVHVSSLSENNKVIFTISDKGRGMSKEQVDNLDAFKQFDRDLFEQQGQGLGIYLAQKIIEIVGGKMLVESVVNEGTTVKVFLPTA